MTRRLLLGLSGLLLAASSGCAVCSSMFDYDYSAHGGRWERGDRAYGRVGSAFAAAETRRPTDDGTESIPLGKPSVDDDGAESGAAGEGGGSAEGEPSESPEAPLVPPMPDKEKAQEPSATDPPAATPPADVPPATAPSSGKRPATGSPVARGKKANPVDNTGRSASRNPDKNLASSAGRNAGRTTERGPDAGWTAKPSRPGAVGDDATSTDGVASDGEGEAVDTATPSTEAGDEAMTESTESDASGALLQAPANE